MAKVKSANATDNSTNDATATVTPAAEPTEKKKKELSEQEHKLIETILKMEQPVSIPDLNEEFGNPLVCMLAIGSAGKKKFIKLEGMNVSVTSEGLEAYNSYVPHERKAREIDPEAAAEREARKIAAYETEFGPLPEWIKNSSRPTNLEFMNIRLRGAENSEEYNNAVVRMFKFNKNAQDNLVKAQTKIEKIRQYIADLEKNPSKANAPCTSTRAQENDDETDES